LFLAQAVRKSRKSAFKDVAHHAVGVRPARKHGAVEARRVVQVVIKGYAHEVGRRPQALGGRSRLLLAVVGRVLLVRTGVNRRPVQAKTHATRYARPYRTSPAAGCQPTSYF
jgi:hypothetical protein